MQRWQSTLDAGAPTRHWDGEYLVFNPLNASTHLLGAAAYEVLAALQQARRALSLPDLAELLLGPEAATDQAFHTELLQCLQQFDDLGLAEPVAA